MTSNIQYLISHLAVFSMWFVTRNIPTYLLHLISLIIYKHRSVIRFGAFPNRYIVTKCYCSSFAVPLRYSAFVFNKTYTLYEQNLHDFWHFFIHNLSFPDLSLHHMAPQRCLSIQSYIEIQSIWTTKTQNHNIHTKF